MTDSMLRLRATRGLFALVAAAALAACGGSDTTGATSTSGGGAGGSEPWQRATPAWSSIYEVYFGPSGVAACGGATACHGSAQQSGSIASNFVCADKDACYASLIGASHLVKLADVASPEKASLFLKLRQPNNTGRMPSSSKFVFEAGDVAVLEDWIAKGAKND